MQNPRKPETQAAYEAFLNDPNSSAKDQRFNFSEEQINAEYQHWYIIKSRFPYDTMVRVNDILVSKRPVSSFKELNNDEHDEYHKIIDDLAAQGIYDARIENFPRAQSVKRHIHVHLICWHNTASGQ